MYQVPATLDAITDISIFLSQREWTMMKRNIACCSIKTRLFVKNEPVNSYLFIFFKKTSKKALLFNKTLYICTPIFDIHTLLKVRNGPFV